MLLMQMDPFFWGVVIFCIVMFSLMILLIVQSVNKDKKATEEIEATIVDVDMRCGYRGSRSYRPVYEYTYMGEDYKVSSDSKIYMTENKVKIGKSVIIHIDPDKPENFKEKWEIKDLMNNPALGMYAVITVLVVIAMYFNVIKMALGLD